MVVGDAFSVTVGLAVGGAGAADGGVLATFLAQPPAYTRNPIRPNSNIPF
jgi:hypothetical protein